MTKLLEQIEKRASDVASISERVRSKDSSGTIAAIASLVASVATGLPGVGKLAGEAARWAFAKSAYGRLEQVAAELDDELDDEQRQKRLASSIAEMVARSLVQMGEPPQRVTEIAGQPDPAFADFQFVPAEIVAVKIDRVSEGGTGVELSQPKGRQIEIEQKEVTGKGSVGVKL